VRRRYRVNFLFFSLNCYYFIILLFLYFFNLTFFDNSDGIWIVSKGYENLMCCKQFFGEVRELVGIGRHLRDAAEP
jgi:hypothetical protein